MTRHGIRFNSMALLLGQVLVKGSSYLVFFVAARFLTEQATGTLTLALAVGLVVELLADFGAGSHTTRQVALQPAHSPVLLADGLLLRLMLGLPLLAAVSGLALLFYPPRIVAAFGLGGAALLLRSVAEFSGAFFAGRGQMHVTARLTGLSAVALALVVVPGLAFLGWTELHALGAYVLVYLLAAAVSLELLRRRLRVSLVRPSLRRGRRLLAEILPFGLHSLFAAIYGQADTILLSLLHSEGLLQVAYYQAAHKLMVAVETPMVVLIRASFPELSRLQAQDPPRFRKLIGRLLLVVLALGLPVAVLFGVFGDRIVGLLYKPGFEPAGLVLRCLALVVPVRICALVLGTALSAIGHQSRRAWASFASVFVSVGLNVVLIPPLGAVGAALANGATFLVVLLLYRRMLGQPALGILTPS
jgi:O-antigen/teichoic acid export membrane protein